tara:strand:- start:6615 stop:8465 length:1851 start_codon:yes stop_codon:yes gene_type:complete
MFQYDKAAASSSTPANGYVLKFYTAADAAIQMASAKDGSGLLSSCVLDSSGYPLNGSPARFTPFIDQEYKIALYSTQALADADTTGSAEWFIGPFDLPVTLGSSIATGKDFTTLALAVASTEIADGDVLNLAERISGSGGGAFWDAVLSSTVTENTFNVVQCTGVGTLSLVLRVGPEVVTREWGCVIDGVTDDYSALDNAYDFAVAAKKPLHISGGSYLVETSLAWGTSNAYVKGVGKQNTIIIRGASISSALATIAITTGDWITFEHFKIDNNNNDGQALSLSGVNESTFRSLAFLDVDVDYYLEIDGSSSNNFYDLFGQNCDQLINVKGVSNQQDFYDCGGNALSTTLPAIKIENCFRVNFFGGICEADTKCLEVGSDVDGVAFYGTYFETLASSGALPDIIVGETTGGNSNTVSFQDCYFVQNADKGAAIMEITSDARNVRIQGGRFSRSIAGTDDLITVTGGAEIIAVENVDTFTISSGIKFFNADSQIVKGLRISNITDINANNTIDIGNASGCQVSAVSMLVIIGASATRVSVEGSPGGAITDNSGLVRWLDTGGLNEFSGGYHSFTERVDVAAPAANKAVTYVRDNGAGKTQLVVRFPTGAIQVLATEP